LPLRRRDQQTQEFKERMNQRNAIDGTVSELARAYGLRRSRYRGFAKVELQNLFIVTACNVKRWLRILAEAQMGSKSQHLPFRQPIHWISRFFRTIRPSLTLLSPSSQVTLFLAHA
jgi:hypothetical protein